MWDGFLLYFYTKSNTYVVGYAARGTSYFLQDNAAERQNRAPVDTLLPGTTLRNDLHFDGTYAGLSRAAVARSGAQPPSPICLGRTELDNAIRNMFFAETESLQAIGFIVIVQMLSEAARFPTIEALIRNSMGVDNAPYTPGCIVESLELNWSDLSEEIQRVGPNQTEFRTPIVLRNLRNGPSPINSVNDKFVRCGGIAMLLYDYDRGNNGSPHDEL